MSRNEKQPSEPTQPPVELQPAGPWVVPDAIVGIVNPSVTTAGEGTTVGVRCLLPAAHAAAHHDAGRAREAAMIETARDEAMKSAEFGAYRAAAARQGEFERAREKLTKEISRLDAVVLGVGADEVISLVGQRDGQASALAGIKLGLGSANTNRNESITRLHGVFMSILTRLWAQAFQVIEQRERVLCDLLRPGTPAAQALGELIEVEVLRGQLHPMWASRTAEQLLRELTGSSLPPPPPVPAMQPMPPPPSFTAFPQRGLRPRDPR